MLIRRLRRWLCEEELNAMSPQRRELTLQQYHNRCARHPQQAPLQALAPYVPRMPVGQRDGVRRIDFMGDRFMFRGLGAMPDGTWAMYLGPPS
jgi:hypothetical protein